MSLLLIVAVLFISVTAVFADDAERIAKAKAEGQVVFYTTMGIDTVRPVTLAFEKKFPFLTPSQVNPLELWDLHNLRQLRDAREL
jgi:hypothetical protein